MKSSSGDAELRIPMVCGIDEFVQVAISMTGNNNVRNIILIVCSLNVHL